MPVRLLLTLASSYFQNPTYDMRLAFLEDFRIRLLTIPPSTQD